MFRLSPSEEIAVLHKTKAERRKARLIQVRQQDKGLAHKVRQDVQCKKLQEQRLLEAHLRANLANCHQKKLKELEVHFLSRVGEFGRGHREAQSMVQDEERLQNHRVLLDAEQRWRDKARHKAAMKELNANQLREKEQREKSARDKAAARAVEDDRANRVANRPVCSDQPLITDVVVSKGQRVQFKEADNYACSYYHIPHTVVQRDTSQGEDCAHLVAQQKSKTNEQLSKHSAVVKMEQEEKAKMRHRYALAKVKLEKDKVEVMSELEMMEREDRTRRQKAIAKMPNNLFQPVHRRLEMASEQQRDMEQAFEKLLLRTRGMRDSHQMSSQAASDSELPPGGGSLADDDPRRGAEQLKGVRFSTLSDSADAPSLTHTSSDTYIPREVSSSSEDLAPHCTQPYPSSPPHQMRAWGTMGHDSLSVTPTPGPPPTTIPHSSEDDSPCKATQTQPVKLQLPRAMAHVLSQPDLSVSDTASTFSTARGGGESDGGRRGDRRGVNRLHSSSMFSGAREREGEWGRLGESDEGVVGDDRSHTAATKGMGSHLFPSASSVSEGRRHPHSVMAMEGVGSGRRGIGEVEEAGEKLRHPHSAIAMEGSRGVGSGRRRIGEVEEAGEELRHPHSAMVMEGSRGVGSGRRGIGEVEEAGEKLRHPHSVIAMEGSRGEGRGCGGIERSGEAGWTKPPTTPQTAAKPPKSKIPDDTMQRLISLVRAQQAEREAAQGAAQAGVRKAAGQGVESQGGIAARLLGEGVEPQGGIAAGLLGEGTELQGGIAVGVLQQGVEPQGGASAGMLQQEQQGGVSAGVSSLSFSTLSTRDSTPSALDEVYHQHPSSHPQPSSRSVTQSPPPLSISQYHTSLEASALSLPHPPPDHPATTTSGLPLYNPALRPPATLPGDAGTLSGLPHSIFNPQNGSSVGLSQNQDLPDGWGHRFVYHDQHVKLERATVDYTALDTRRDLSVSTLTGVDFSVPAGVMPVLTDNENGRTTSMPDPSAPSNVAGGHPSLGTVPVSLSSMGGGTYRHLAPPSLDVTLSSITTAHHTEMEAGHPSPGTGTGHPSFSTEPISPASVGRGTYRHLAPPSLDVTASSIATAQPTTHTAGGRMDSTGHPSIGTGLYSMGHDAYRHLTAPSLDVTSSSIVTAKHAAYSADSTETVGDHRTALCTGPISLHSVDGDAYRHLVAPSLDVTASSIATTSHSLREETGETYETRIDEQQHHGPISHPLQKSYVSGLSHVPAREGESSEFTEFGPAFVTPKLYSYIESSHRSSGGSEGHTSAEEMSYPTKHAATNSSAPPLPYVATPTSVPFLLSPEPSFQVSQEQSLQSSLFLPLAEASFQASIPSPSIYTPLRPVAYSQRPFSPSSPAYSQGQQRPMSPPATYSQGQQRPMPLSSVYSQGQTRSMSPSSPAYSRGQQRPMSPPAAYSQGQQRPMSPSSPAYSRGQQRPMSPSSPAWQQRPASPSPAAYNQGQQRFTSPSPACGEEFQSPSPAAYSQGKGRPMSPSPAAYSQGQRRPMSPSPAAYSQGQRRPVSPSPTAYSQGPISSPMSQALFSHRPVPPLPGRSQAGVGDQFTHGTSPAPVYQHPVSKTQTYYPSSPILATPLEFPHMTTMTPSMDLCTPRGSSHEIDYHTPQDSPSLITTSTPSSGSPEQRVRLPASSQPQGERVYFHTSPKPQESSSTCLQSSAWTPLDVRTLSGDSDPVLTPKVMKRGLISASSTSGSHASRLLASGLSGEGGEEGPGGRQEKGYADTARGPSATKGRVGEPIYIPHEVRGKTVSFDIDSPSTPDSLEAAQHTGANHSTMDSALSESISPQSVYKGARKDFAGQGQGVARHIPPKKSPERTQGQALGASPLSLQEAFLQRNTDFIGKSHERMQQLKANAAKRQRASTVGVVGRSQQGRWHAKGRQTATVTAARRGMAKKGEGTRGVASPTKQDVNISPGRQTTRTGGMTSPKVRGVSKSPVGRTLRQTTQSGGITQEHGSSNVVRSQSLHHQDNGHGAELVFPSARQKEKIKMKEMKERNLRFYRKLPEVKRKTAEETRAKEYAENRMKAKLYQQQLQLKMKAELLSRHTDSDSKITKKSRLQFK